MSNNTLQFSINISGNAYTGIAQIDRMLGRVNVNAKKTESLLEGINTVAFKVNNIFSGIQNTIGKVSGAIGQVINLGSENELQKMNMTTLFKGNVAAAEDMFAKISKYGKETVYDKAGLIDAQRTMMSFGLSGEQSFETLKQIGDIAMGDKQKMQSLALAFAQATSAGKLQGQDLMQLINAGFNPLQTISERTGESLISLKDKMSKGQISAEMLAQAFQWATDESGLFYEGATKAGVTTAGRINQLKDTFDEFIISVFDKLKPVIDYCIDFASNVLSTLPDTFEKIRSAVSSLLGPIIAVTTAWSVYKFIIISINAWQFLVATWKSMLAAYEVVVFAVKNATSLWAATQWLLNVALSANPVAVVIAGIVALIAVIAYVCSRITGWGTLWEGLMGFMKNSFYAFVDGVKLYFSTFINGFLMGLDKIKLGWYKFKEACGIGDSDENKNAIAAINADIEARQKAIADGAKSMIDNATKAKDSLVKGFGGLSWKSSADDMIGASNSAKTSVQGQIVAATNGGMSQGVTQGAMPSASQSTNAVATGGTRNTNITIKIDDMIKQVVFNGSTSDNKESVEKNFAECLYRVLGMAQNSI